MEIYFCSTKKKKWVANDNSRCVSMLPLPTMATNESRTLVNCSFYRKCTIKVDVDVDVDIHTSSIVLIRFFHIYYIYIMGRSVLSMSYNIKLDNMCHLVKVLVMFTLHTFQ